MIKVATIVFFREEGFSGDFVYSPADGAKRAIYSMSGKKQQKAMEALHAKGEGWFYKYRGIQNPCCDELEGLIVTAMEMETMGGERYYGDPGWDNFKWCPYCGNPVEQEIVAGEIVPKENP